MDQIWTSTNVFYQLTRCLPHKQIWFSSSVTMIPLFGMFLPLFSNRQNRHIFKGPLHTCKSSKSLHSLNKHLSLMCSVSVTKLTFILHAFTVSASQYGMTESNCDTAESAKFRVQCRDKLYLNRVVNHWGEAFRGNLGYWQRNSSLQR